MDAFFPGGLWPPKLGPLTIGGLKKPIFPTSLFNLHLYGGPYEEVTDFSRLSEIGINFNGTPTPHLSPASLHCQVPKDDGSTRKAVAFAFEFGN
uniref:Uncharacterized protein n=1 Tax=Lactuca sativa TaxID=4236 RepID=A0A9R1W3A7_LACSA|nr:hypothetical protein LSAT_V11C300149830 [Lactuca sativa]